ncbi:DUF3857 domain-containing protein [Cytophagaceae bacterium YF14B1]|uniref:DUF3857 domain-containing protein n=1 Tax=Xanthocytophaga flava TaxID=3048013 RepID=A0AAE3UBN5_9BACT|nr:DUF3857 domain-containing protein [Xanthocytophaga flavus]MDJ1484578.1 DUF3857 domain-containing protein [Xanthocytophaga flavus]
MKRYLLLITLVFLGMYPSYAEILYPVSTISETLKKDAHAVIRLHETIFTIKSVGEAIERTHYVITILDEQGEAMARNFQYYDKMNRITEFDGILYDALGSKVKTLKKTDIRDISAADGFSLYTDMKFKIASFTYAQYPYTVEFTSEVVTTNLMYYPQWFPQNDEEVSLEKATLTVLCPKNITLRYKEQKMSSPAQVQTTGEVSTYKWTLENLPALTDEPNAPSNNEIISGVYLSPSDFEVSGYKGNMTSWENLGRFQSTLLAGRDELPENVKQQITQITAKETNKIDKIKKVYEYLQANTRYVSIQMGIGGWQPFDAKTVAQNGYGDCKALSNYTKAMLKAIGIESYYTIIGAGSTQSDLLIDFSSRVNFNHAILCVPVEKDTIWLECTSQTNPFGYQGSFTGNRHALLITPDGGKLVKTTQYTAKDNLASRKVLINLDVNGDANVEALSTYYGEQQEDLSYILNTKNQEEQKKALYKKINVPSYEINQFSLTEKKARIPSVTEKLSLTVRKCGSKSGTRMFITPNVMNASSYIPPKTENRKNEIVLRMAYQDIDTVVYQLPKGYGIEFVPETIKIESKFGTYQSSLQTKEGEITYIRSVTVNRGKYPASAYNEWVDFRKKIVKADKTQMVLVNKGS